jgi:hypothetical protein
MKRPTPTRQSQFVPKERPLPLRMRDGSLALRLQEQGMPPKDVAAVLEARDPDVVHRYIELHIERLEERLADQRRTLALIENLFVESIAAGIERYGVGNGSQSNRGNAPVE